MTVVVDTSILIDLLRGRPEAVELLQRKRRAGPLWASEITRLEVLAGMRASEEADTRALLAVLRWRTLDAEIAEHAGALGRRWLPSHSGIDGADLAVAATVVLLRGELLTMNIKHFPMFADLTRPY